LRNPAQLDKPFYCGSCHDPHSTNTLNLLRFNAQSAQDLCKNRHQAQKNIFSSVILMKPALWPGREKRLAFSDQQ
jgi:predicted CXXCH cytochrome family protein